MPSHPHQNSSFLFLRFEIFDAQPNENIGSVLSFAVANNYDRDGLDNLVDCERMPTVVPFNDRGSQSGRLLVESDLVVSDFYGSSTSTNFASHGILLGFPGVDY